MYRLQSNGALWWRRLVNAYKVKAGMVWYWYDDTWALQRRAFHDWALYKSILPFILILPENVRSGQITSGSQAPCSCLLCIGYSLMERCCHHKLTKFLQSARSCVSWRSLEIRSMSNRLLCVNITHYTLEKQYTPCRCSRVSSYTLTKWTRGHVLVSCDNHNYTSHQWLIRL